MDNQEKPKCFITSVGTSLVENAGGDFNEIADSDANPDEFCKRCEQDNQFKQDYLKGYVQLVVDEEKFSAEIDAMKDILGKDDRIVFLSSKTDIAYFCACGLKCYFTQFSDPILPEDQVEIIIVEGLRKPEDEEFETRGLPDFLNKVVRNIQHYKDTHEILLNPTGGYKSLFPLMTIAGIIYGLKVIYTYEKTKKLIKIPPLPLHVNLPAWTQMETLIRLFDGKDDFAGRKIYGKSKDHFGLMLYESENRLRASALVQAFAEHAEQERGKPELIVRTENSPLINLLDSEEKEIFLRLTQIGHLIWKGDKVPEMADHSLRHHSDLFHLAERVLLPIFYYKEDFLKSHELFILLCALYLHDCGHVIDRIQLENGDTLPLFPVEIRDHHHVLGYLRLKYPEIKSYLGFLIYDHLCDTSGKSDTERKEKWKKAWHDYFQAVATLGLYHRKKMLLEKDNVYPFYSAYAVYKEEDKQFLSLKQRLDKTPVRVFGNPVLFERVKLLVSLLRIIDSLDEQASRTGNANDIRFHLKQLEADAEIEEKRKEMLESAVPVEIRTRLDESLEKFIRGFKGKEEKGFDDKKSETIKTPEEFREQADGFFKENPLYFEYANAYLRSFFKKFQIKPYKEKAYVKGIDIHHAESEGRSKIIIRINLKMEDDPDKLAILKAMFPLGDLDAHKANMLKSIKSEYVQTDKDDKPLVTEVKDTLEQFGIQIQYGESL